MDDRSTCQCSKEVPDRHKMFDGERKIPVVRGANRTALLVLRSLNGSLICCLKEGISVMAAAE